MAKSTIKKLNPDLLQDAIVEVRYSTKLPHEVMLGFLYNLLEPLGFSVINQQPENLSVTGFMNSNLILEDDTNRIKLSPKSFVFNIKESYSTWEEYLPRIMEVCKTINDSGYILSYERIGLRFVNSVKDDNIFDKVIDEFRVNLADYENNFTTVKTEVKDDTYRIIVNVGNGYPSKDGKEFVSLLDIDVIYEPDGVIEFSSLEEAIDGCHEKEKELFEYFIDKDYLKTLNPEFK